MPETIGDELAGRDRHHRLVQQRQALLDPPACRIRMWPCSWAASANRSGSPKRSPIAAASPAVAAAASRSPRRLLLEHDRQQQVAALDAVAPSLLEQPLGAAEPAAGAARSPRAVARLTPIQNAQRSGAAAARRRRVSAVGALEARRSYSSSRPSMYAAVASSSRSSGSSTVSRSASASPSYASPHVLAA